jgi:hypothetical protein
MTMGKSVAVLALVAGVGLAVAMHGTYRADPPQRGPELPALAQMAAQPGPDLDADWPARAELAGLVSGCAGCLAAQAGVSWQGARPGLRIGLEPPAALDRLQAAPRNPAANPLLVPGDASLNDLPRLDMAPAPEPQSWAMFLAGMALVGRQLRRRRPAYLATL